MNVVSLRRPRAVAAVAGVGLASLLTSRSTAKASVPEIDLETMKPPGSHVRETVSAGQMLRRNPVAKLFVDQDHMFDGLQEMAMVREWKCYFDANKSDPKFVCAVQLGDNVCGFPKTVHGGLTAALIDETSGGLYFSMLGSGKLGPSLPGYTARLEVDYKAKAPASSVMVCTCEVESREGRKVWIAATVCDGSGLVYAKGRALFVAPSVKKWALRKLGFLQQTEPPATAPE